MYGKTLIFVLPWLLFSCVESIPVQPEAQAPQVLRMYAPAAAFLGDSRGILVHAAVSEPQGVQDIAVVTLHLITPAGENKQLDMRDDGSDGDIIAADGQFVARVPGSLWSSSGKGALYAAAADLEGNSAVSDTLSIAIREGEPGAEPVLQSLLFPDTVYVDSSYQILLLASVHDPDGLENIDSVGYALYQTYAASPSMTGLLVDDGAGDDGVAGNGIYGVALSSTSLPGVIGTSTILVRAYDAQGNSSNPLMREFFSGRLIGNVAPVIEQVFAPDSLSRASNATFVVRARVRDRNGLGDIKRVFFNSFLPGGTPSSQNPFLLKDDGVKDNNGFGDAVAGDGEYSLTLQIPTTAATGEYRFEFQAEDRTGLVSNKVVHILRVTQ
ncbi:MAG TPA: hypothetical protein ENJ29_08900 [Bacteroidetes bacterium]|nr:hypothetical protein [Bacteroidota bacterium]